MGRSLIRCAREECGTLPATSTSAGNISVDGRTREVPLEPCYYAAISAGRVSLAGETFEQAVTEDGALASLTVWSVFAPTAGELTLCDLPRE